MPRRQTFLSKTVADANYVVRATLRNSLGTTIRGVVCGIFLPNRQTEPIRLQFQPTAMQANRLNFAQMRVRLPELAFKATTRHGGRRIRFSADRVWCTSISAGYRYGISYVSDFTGTPDKLTITQTGVGLTERRQGTFFLTPSALINTALSIEQSFTGNVKVRWAHRPKFSLRQGVKLTFAQHFGYVDSKRHETTTFSDLVAEFRLTDNSVDISAASDELDAYLLLTSFAERHRCVCLGWTYTDLRGNLIQQYRRDIAIPKEQDESRDYIVIDRLEFPKFIRAVYPRYCKFVHKDQFNSAIFPLVNDANKTTEMSYFSLFSALESALLFADRTSQLFPPGHQSINKRWGLFQNKYSVDLSDLWPLTDKTHGITLAQLRNRVGHGEYLDPAQTHALLYATEHVRWSVERVMLTLLGWPIAKSRVSPARLAYLHSYANWKQARSAF
jgi:hypothetical protein